MHFNSNLGSDSTTASIIKRFNSGNNENSNMDPVYNSNPKIMKNNVGFSTVTNRVALSDVTSQVSNKLYSTTSHNNDGFKFKETNLGHNNNHFNGGGLPKISSIAIDCNDYNGCNNEIDEVSYIKNDIDEDSLTEDEGLNKVYSGPMLQRQEVIDLDNFNDENILQDLDKPDTHYKIDVIQDHHFEEQDRGLEKGDEEDESESREPLSILYNDKIQASLDYAFDQCHKSFPDPMDDDTYDVVMVVELTNDIFKYLRELELKYKPDPYYMNIQSELKWSYRSTLIDWIVQVHSRFQLLPETLYLTVNIIDRFLSKKVVTLNRFQLVGAAALFVAAKYEEINCPTLKDIVYMLDNAYTRDDVIKAERFMIDTLGFEIGWPGPMSFLRRISKADDYEYDIRTLAKYLLEITIMDSRLVAAPPSWLATGAYFLSKIILGYNDWSIHHIYYSGYTQEQIFPLATTILENCRQASTKHEAIWKKYSERRQHRSAQIVAKWIALAEDKIEQTA